MEIYLCLLVAAALIFYCGARFERARARWAKERFAVDELPPPPAPLPKAYVPSKKQLGEWAKERSVIPTAKTDRTLRNVVFGRPTRITPTRPN